MRALGVDVGEVRIGLALSDGTGTIASPLETIAAGDDVDDLARRVHAVAQAHVCETVVVGLPRSLSGGETLSTRRARALAQALERAGSRVELWDERLTSAEAEQMLVRAGRRRRQRRTERDRVAAALILQGWLDARTAS